MAQITETQRIQRIKELLAELNKVPPERHEVVRLPWAAGHMHCSVIVMGVDEVLLNHRSHRVRAQLQSDPEWAGLENSPQSEAAQRVIERKVRAARTPEQFAALKDSLQREKQLEPGVMTHKGVLINANTRAVALRDFEDPADRYIRVAVLPPTAKQDELALLELRLQMQKELKVDYTLSNELLFIEELSVDRRLSDAQIARELRFHPESPRKGETEVRTRLQMLDLIREMQAIPSEPLKLTFFDDIAYEQLRELQRVYRPLLDENPSKARAHLEAFLLSIAAGVTSVHQIRRVDSSFVSDYMRLQLEEDEVVGPFAGQLLARQPEQEGAPQAAAKLRVPNDDDDTDVDVKSLIDMITRRDKRVPVPGSTAVLGQGDLKQAVKTSIITGIKERRRDERDSDKLEGPTAAVKEAVREVTKALESLEAVASDPDFDAPRRRTLEAAFKRLRRVYGQLEASLEKADVLRR